MKKTVITLSALIAALCLLFSIGALTAVASARESDVIRAEFIRPEDAAAYFYLDEPYSIGASESNLYIATCNAGAYEFSKDGKFVRTIDFNSDAERVVSCRGKLFTVHGGVLFGESDAQGGEQTDGEADASTRASAALASDIVNVCTDENTVYALTSSSLLSFKIDESGRLEKEQIEHGISMPIHVAASGGNVYLVADSGKNGYQSDAYLFDLESGKSVKILTKTAHVSDVAAVSKEALVLLQNGEISRYELKGGALKSVAVSRKKNIRSVTASDGKVYALSGSGAVIALDAALETADCLLASSSDGDWFYDTPLGISTRRDFLLVADYGNDRIVKIDNDGFGVIPYELSQPTAAVCDYLGRTYVAHDGSVIDILDRKYENIGSVSLGQSQIVDLKLDLLGGALYALTADGCVYCVESGSDQAVLKEYGAPMNAIAATTDGTKLYGMSFETKKIYDLDKREPLLSYDCEAAAFAVDLKDNFYLLTRGGEIIKYSSEDGFSQAVSKEFESGYVILSGADRITLSTVKNAYLDYGDIIVGNSERHCLQKVAAADYGVMINDADFTVPDNFTDASPMPARDESIIRVTLADADIYDKPIDMSPAATAKAGKKVFVAEYESEGAFSYIVYDDAEKNCLVRGYVLRSLLSESVAYKPSTNKTATVYSNNTAIYKWPSRNSEKANGYESTSKDSAFPLLDFVYDGRTQGGASYYGMTDEYADSWLWYRISLPDGKEGYVPATSVTVGSYVRSTVIPQFNAKVISPTGAPMYEKDGDGKFVMMQGEQPLEYNTKVEVVGAFDASREYTLVRYYNDVYGATLEGYVRTEHLKYSRVGVLTIVIIILVILSVAGITTTIVWHFVAKKKKMTRA